MIIKAILADTACDEPFGPEFLDLARNPEFIEGLKAEGLVAGRIVLKIRLPYF
ncbi:MAG: hypothetical protein ISS66_04875 [Desulfobacteraceae bacterium]|nr:hypothetical protein [Desulfobacteraceae bacterium]